MARKKKKLKNEPEKEHPYSNSCAIVALSLVIISLVLCWVQLFNVVMLLASVVLSVVALRAKPRKLAVVALLLAFLNLILILFVSNPFFVEM